jgi:hypothetical protein
VAYFWIAVQLVITSIHKIWILSIYLVSLVLSTFWVQEIFDHTMTEKIKLTKSKIKFQPLSGKDVLVDLMMRT